MLESRLGLPLEEALEAVAQRMQSKDFHWVVMAIRINKRVGGNLAEVLTNVSLTLRERERLRRQVKTLSAEGVLSAWILGVLPFVIGLFIVWRNPGYLEPMVTTVLGWIMIAVGVILYVVGSHLDAQPREDGGLTHGHVLVPLLGIVRPLHWSCRSDRPRGQHRTGAFGDLVLHGRDRGHRWSGSGGDAHGI